MQELEKILEEIKEALEENKVIELNGDGTVNRYIIDVASAWGSIKAIIHNHINDGWIPVEECLPEDGTDVLVVLKPTYESDYIEYSIARYLRFENDEAHWCDNHYGYLEWEKYSDGHGGSSWYRVVAWQKLDSYHPERSDNHDGE